MRWHCTASEDSQEFVTRACFGRRWTDRETSSRTNVHLSTSSLPPTRKQSQRTILDGNKRTALTCLGVFLERNGFTLTAPEPDIVAAMLKVADGSLSRDALAAWVKDNVQSLV